jgi:hypothetical protein
MQVLKDSQGHLIPYVGLTVSLANPGYKIPEIITYVSPDQNQATIQQIFRPNDPPVNIYRDLTFDPAAHNNPFGRPSEWKTVAADVGVNFGGYPRTMAYN